MGKTIEETLDKAKAARLNAAEKSLIRENIIAFMESHPIIEEEVYSASAEKQNTALGPGKSLWFIFGPLRGFAILTVFFLILITGTGITVAAELSKPGDPLFPLKQKMDKKLADLSAATSQIKAKWNHWQMETKLNDTGDLAASGKLTDDSKAQVEIYLDSYSNNLNDNLNTLTQSNHYAAAQAIINDYESMVSAHEKIIRNLKSDNGSAKNAIADILKAQLANVKKAKVDIVDKISNEKDFKDDAAKTGVENAEKTIGELNQFIKVHSGIQGKERLEKASEAAEQKIAEAIIAEAAGDTKQALTALNEAYIMAKKSKIVGEALNNYKDKLPSSTLKPEDTDVIPKSGKQVEIPISELLDPPAVVHGNSKK